MFGPARGLETEFFEEKTMKGLKEKVNLFLQSLAVTTEILDIKYHSDIEEYNRHFTAMIVFRNK
jgi:hypothetical protein